MWFNLLVDLSTSAVEKQKEKIRALAASDKTLREAVRFFGMN
jgi:hypothetical protein